MMQKIFGFFKSSNSTKDNLAKLNLIGRLCKKKIGINPQEIAEEAIISLAISNENTYDYILIVETEEWENNKSKNLN
jgi:hypothetical protein